jgi:urate oxidase
MARLAANSYGKSEVRLTKVVRNPDRHDLIEYSVNIQLRGEFAASYLTGDNTSVLPTDTMKNTVYGLAAQNEFDSPEAFAMILAEHFMSRNPQVSEAEIRIAQTRWNRIKVAGKRHPHAFVDCGPEKRTCAVRKTRSSLSVGSGIDNLIVLKTTDSAFKGFPRDPFTTLVETDDRIFATSVQANWEYGDTSGDWNQRHDEVRTAIVETFATHMSLAVQQTLYAMGEAALAACKSVRQISFRLPNQHRIPFNLEPLGLKNTNSIFVTTSEPYGDISGTVVRD